MNVQTIGLAVLALFALVIWAGVSIIQSNCPARTKAIWLAIVVLLPVVGLIAWIAAGPRPNNSSR